MAASMYMMLFGEFVYMPAEIHNVNLGDNWIRPGWPLLAIPPLAVNTTKATYLDLPPTNIHECMAYGKIIATLRETRETNFTGKKLWCVLKRSFHPKKHQKTMKLNIQNSWTQLGGACNYVFSLSLGWWSSKSTELLLLPHGVNKPRFSLWQEGRESLHHPWLSQAWFHDSWSLVQGVFCFFWCRFRNKDIEAKRVCLVRFLKRYIRIYHMFVW